MKLNEVVNKQVLTQEEIEREMREAEEQGRMVDFSNKLIKSFFVLKDKVKHGITFENTVIDGQFFLGEITIEGDLILRDTKVKGSVYLARLRVKGDLDIEGLVSNGAINLVGAEIGKDLRAQRIHSRGFLSLAKTTVGGSIILDKAKIENTTTQFDKMVIRGDLILEGAKANGGINIKDAQIDGMLDLDEVDVGTDLILVGTVFKNIEDSDMHIKGKKIN